jgi:uncharacterized protein (DUF433 family)
MEASVERITIEPGKRGGKPCNRGLRITVWDVLGWLGGGMSEAEILDEHPDLEQADSIAVYQYAAEIRTFSGDRRVVKAERDPDIRVRAGSDHRIARSPFPTFAALRSSPVDQLRPRLGEILLGSGNINAQTIGQVGA